MIQGGRSHMDLIGPPDRISSLVALQMRGKSGSVGLFGLMLGHYKGTNSITVKECSTMRNVWTVGWHDSSQFLTVRLSSKTDLYWK